MPEMKHTSTPAKLNSKIYGNNDGGGKIFALGPGTGTFVQMVNPHTSEILLLYQAYKELVSIKLVTPL